MERDTVLLITFGLYLIFNLSKFRSPSFRKDFSDMVSLRDPFGRKYYRNNPDIIIAFVLLIAVFALF